MARPGVYNLVLYRGDTYAWQFVLYSDNLVPPTPADLTGVSAKAEIRNAPGGSLLAALPCVVTQPNTITMKLTTTEWAGLRTPAAYWDLQLTYADADSSVVTILAGTVSVTPDVTDSTPVSVTTVVGVSTRG